MTQVRRDSENHTLRRLRNERNWQYVPRTSGGFSIGDTYLIAGFLTFLIGTVYRLPIINPIKEGNIVEKL